MPRFIDLDEIVPDDIHVRLNGEIYRLPGDIPVPDRLRFELLLERITDRSDPRAANEASREAYERLLAMFQARQPTMENIPVGWERLLPLILEVFYGDAEQQEVEKVPPPRGGTPTKNSGARRKTTTSRKPKTARGSSR